MSRDEGRVLTLLPLEHIQPLGFGVRFGTDTEGGYAEMVLGAAVVCRWRLTTDELDHLRSGFGDLHQTMAEMVGALIVGRCPVCATMAGPDGPRCGCGKLGQDVRRAAAQAVQAAREVPGA